MPDYQNIPGGIDPIDRPVSQRVIFKIPGGDIIVAGFGGSFDFNTLYVTAYRSSNNGLTWTTCFSDTTLNPYNGTYNPLHPWTGPDGAVVPAGFYYNSSSNILYMARIKPDTWQIEDGIYYYGSDFLGGTTQVNGLWTGQIYLSRYDFNTDTLYKDYAELTNGSSYYNKFINRGGGLALVVESNKCLWFPGGKVIGDKVSEVIPRLSIDNGDSIIVPIPYSDHDFITLLDLDKQSFIIGAGYGEGYTAILGRADYVDGADVYFTLYDISTGVNSLGASIKIPCHANSLNSCAVPRIFRRSNGRLYAFFGFSTPTLVSTTDLFLFDITDLSDLQVNYDATRNFYAPTPTAHWQGMVTENSDFSAFRFGEQEPIYNSNLDKLYIFSVSPGGPTTDRICWTEFDAGDLSKGPVGTIHNNLSITAFSVTQLDDNPVIPADIGTKVGINYHHTDTNWFWLVPEGAAPTISSGWIIKEIEN